MDKDEDEEMINYDINWDDEGNENNNADESNAHPILDNEPQIDRGLASTLAIKYKIIIDKIIYVCSKFN